MKIKIGDGYFPDMFGAAQYGLVEVGFITAAQMRDRKCGG